MTHQYLMCVSQKDWYTSVFRYNADDVANMLTRLPPERDDLRVVRAVLTLYCHYDGAAHHYNSRLELMEPLSADNVIHVRTSGTSVYVKVPLIEGPW